ncbi:MAG: Uma2 family endonuclease [Sandaracinaceae bacterium]|nr:Uma2 family endonuclease [Sandaracinaceae bacterium]
MVQSLAGVRPLRRVEYDRLVSAGAFEGERVELLDGQVMRMPPHGPEHDGTIDVLLDILRPRIGERARIRVQQAFAATDDAEPEPDVALVPMGDYRDAHPSKAFLVVEIAVSSVAYDREKAAIYARAGVPEYWLVDVVRGAVEIYRDPSADGYDQRTTHRRPDVLRCAAFSDVEVPLDRLLRG